MLDRTHSYKPLDFGNGLVAGSVNEFGQLVALNTYHPEAGYITLSCQNPFPAEWRYQPEKVRQYRNKLASPNLPGFGLAFPQQTTPLTNCYIDTPAVPRVEFQLENGIAVNITSCALYFEAKSYPGAIQLVTITNPHPEEIDLPLEWSGSLTLTTASYTQLTEGGPLPRPDDVYAVSVLDNIAVLENKALGRAVAIMVGAVSPENGKPETLTGATFRANPRPEGGYKLALNASLLLKGGSVKELLISYIWGNSPEEALQNMQKLANQKAATLVENSASLWKKLATTAYKPTLEAQLPGANWLIRQALTYILACCAVPISPTATCLITDHQLLPLAWTRDSYYQAQALLALYKKALRENNAEMAQMIARLLRGHLVWLFEVAERPHGYWGRSYLANGRCKDLAYQLDQQCYPLLELMDYLEVTGDRDFALQPKLEEIVEYLLAQLSPEGWLFPTTETPADDKVAMPYHLSSQILVWYLFKRLTKADLLEKYSAARLLEISENIRRDIYQYMVVRENNSRLFCYLTDLKGNYQLYHDANDWPTSLAPTWGFCAEDDPLWQATMDFAFSPANLRGYYNGAFGGLGSVHTPHSWPLGDVQELLFSQRVGDRDRELKLWDKLKAVACWDGALPEACYENTGQVASRHWFSWPGSVLAALLL